MWFVGSSVAFADDPLDAVAASIDLVPTRPADRHVTLVFLGPVPQDTAMDVWRALPTFTLPEHVRAVAWDRFGRNALALSVVDDDGQLRAATEVCIDVADAQLTYFRRPPGSRPHVTLARLRKRARLPTSAELRGWPVPAGPLEVGPPTLFRSRGSAAGDRFEVVARREG